MGSKGPPKTDLLPGTLDMLILRTLAHRVQHGYGIARHIRQLSDEVLQVEEGSLYPALQRLQVRGWVKSEWGHSANGRRARYYRLTPAGRKQLGIELSRFERLLKAITQVIHPSEAMSSSSRTPRSSRSAPESTSSRARSRHATYVRTS